VEAEIDCQLPAMMSQVRERVAYYDVPRFLRNDAAGDQQLPWFQ
jgi:hypothetical protein